MGTGVGVSQINTRDKRDEALGHYNGPGGKKGLFWALKSGFPRKEQGKGPGEPEKHQRTKPARAYPQQTGAHARSFLTMGKKQRKLGEKSDGEGGWSPPK